MSKQQSKQSPVPCCAFCKGAGEPKEVFNSHWQFSKPVDGKLICPKLLAYKCKSCNETGHIEKRCPFPRKKQEQEQDQSKFCRFCCNAGHAEYTEHNQFDKDGFVTCPALINIECQQCGKKGHTKKYCGSNAPVAIASTPKKADKPQTVPGAPKKPANKFATLFVDEVDACEVGACEPVAVPEIDIIQSQNMEKFPSLPTKLKENKQTMLTGWATIAALPEKKQEPTPQVITVQTSVGVAKEDSYEEKPHTESTSWADW